MSCGYFQIFLFSLIVPFSLISSIDEAFYGVPSVTGQSSFSFVQNGNNPAGNYFLENAVEFSASPLAYGIPELNSISVNFKSDINQELNSSIAFHGLNASLFNFYTLKPCISLKPDNSLVLSVSGRISGMWIKDFESHIKAGIDVGCVVELKKGFYTGISITNINGAVFPDEVALRKVTAGLTFKLFEGLYAETGFILAPDYYNAYILSVTYCPAETIKSRIALQSIPVSGELSASIYLNKEMNLILMLVYNPDLGSRQFIGIQYLL